MVDGPKKSRISFVSVAILLAASLPFLLLAILGLEDWLLRTNIVPAVYERLGLMKPLRALWNGLVWLLGG